MHGFPYSRLECAFYGINWVHNMFGMSSPCASPIVKNVLEAGKRVLAKPISKKEPVTYSMILNICEKYASVNVNLSELRVAALCVTAFYAFLRFNEIAALRCCDLKFCSTARVQFVELFIVKSKTDIYRNGSIVLLAYTGGLVCPFSILKRYRNSCTISFCSPQRNFFVRFTTSRL